MHEKNDNRGEQDTGAQGEQDELHVCVVNVSPYVFGAEKSMAFLVNMLKDRAVHFHLVSPGGGTEDIFKAMGSKNVYQLPMSRFVKSRNPFILSRQTVQWLWGNIRMAALLRSIKPDLVHANGLHAMLYLCISVWLLRFPVIWHVRDLKPPKLIARILSRIASTIISPSRAFLAVIDWPAHKTLLVHNPISFSGTEVALTNSTCGMPEAALVVHSTERMHGAFRIGLVGQIIPRKGHHLLLEALPAILRYIPHAEVHFVGEDAFNPDSAYVQSLRQRVKISNVLRDRVFFHGYRSNVISIYESLDLVVAPSEEELFGRVAIEAMYFGRPLVASRTGGLAENIEHRRNGLLFEAGNSHELADCVIEAATLPDLRDSLVEGGRRFCAKYTDTVEESAKQLRNLYERLARDGRK
jgi:glycosyltransferase involved in cell wall biosynthesis